MKRIYLPLVTALFSLALLLPQPTRALSYYQLDGQNLPIVADDISRKFGTPYATVLDYLGEQVSYLPISADVPPPRDFEISSKNKRHIQFRWAEQSGQDLYHGSYFSLLSAQSGVFETSESYIDLLLPEGYQYHIYTFASSKNRIQSIIQIFIVDRDAFLTGGGPRPSPGTSDRFQLPGSVFPNPASERSTLRLELASQQEIAVEVYSPAGQSLLQPFRGRLDRGRHEIPLDLSTLPAGWYVLRLQTATGPSQMLLIRGE
ncbi:MAG: T9SS type A sorting domain-containing protein [Bacteroidota bacterium]